MKSKSKIAFMIVIILLSINSIYPVNSRNGLKVISADKSSTVKESFHINLKNINQLNSNNISWKIKRENIR